ncbi:MAG: DNA replication and repair protein RecF [Candidatus Saccharibacteria bacterium]|nr:DNA replication and repair protein RecF [Candidatus Saccharibacteria bacterium]
MNVIQKINLKNFRCHNDFSLDCNRPTTLIIGENGSGKTSVLEAIYMALRGKSFKAVDKDIMRRESEFYRVEVDLCDAKKIIIRYNPILNKKEYEIDGKKSIRLPKKNKYPVVLFEPNNIYLIESSPSRRRDYFDELFRQIDNNYTVILGRYNKALKQRNDLLKKEFVERDDLFSWDILCAQYGAQIKATRLKILKKINEKMTENYRWIAKNEDSCRIDYVGEDVDENAYMARLAAGFERDRALGCTSFGVHRDDYKFIFNESDADGSASRGEMRSIILALKFIEAGILEKETGYRPVVLLDDIFSELDEMRQKHLVQNFKDYQMIVTSTNVPAEMTVNKNL